MSTSLIFLESLKESYYLLPLDCLNLSIGYLFSRKGLYEELLDVDPIIPFSLLTGERDISKTRDWIINGLTILASIGSLEFLSLIKFNLLFLVLIFFYYLLLSFKLVNFSYCQSHITSTLFSTTYTRNYSLTVMDSHLVVICQFFICFNIFLSKYKWPVPLPMINISYYAIGVTRVVYKGCFISFPGSI